MLITLIVIGVLFYFFIAGFFFMWAGEGDDPDEAPLLFLSSLIWPLTIPFFAGAILADRLFSS